MRTVVVKNQEGFKKTISKPSLKRIPGNGGYRTKKEIPKKFIIELFDSYTGQFIREFESVLDAAVHFEIGESTINRSIKSGQPDDRGFLWKRKFNKNDTETK